MSWHRGGGDVRRTDLLEYRVIERDPGAPARTFLLLHGIASTHHQFDSGWDSLAAHGTVLIPDLLGFGGSLDRSRRHFSLEDHLAAVDGVLRAVDPDAGELVVAGHSLGGALGLCVAARHAARTSSVTTWGAPLHSDAHEARAHVRSMGRINSMFGLDTRLAQVTCRLICRYPSIARPIYHRVRPKLPTDVLEGSMQHSWWSYVAAMRSIILDVPWLAAIDELGEAAVPVNITAGSDDTAVDHELMRAFASRIPTCSFDVLDGMDHDLPIAHPQLCVDRLVALL